VSVKAGYVLYKKDKTLCPGKRFRSREKKKKRKVVLLLEGLWRSNSLIHALIGYVTI